MKPPLSTPFLHSPASAPKSAEPLVLALLLGSPRDGAPRPTPLAGGRGGASGGALLFGSFGASPFRRRQRLGRRRPRTLATVQLALRRAREGSLCGPPRTAAACRRHTAVGGRGRPATRVRWRPGARASAGGSAGAAAAPAPASRRRSVWAGAHTPEPAGIALVHALRADASPEAAQPPRTGDRSDDPPRTDSAARDAGCSLPSKASFSLISPRHPCQITVPRCAPAVYRRSRSRRSASRETVM